MGMLKTTRDRWGVLFVLLVAGYAVYHEAVADSRWSKEKAARLKDFELEVEVDRRHLIQELETAEREGTPPPFGWTVQKADEDALERLQHFKTNQNLRDNPFSWFR